MPVKDVEEYLSAVPDEQRSALEGLRQMIRAAAPGAVEGISYGVPMFKLNGKPLVSFGSAKNHCAFYVQSPAVMDAHAAELKGYDTAKGTVRFAADKPLPAELLKTLVQARIEENEAAAKGRGRTA